MQIKNIVWLSLAIVLICACFAAAQEEEQFTKYNLTVVTTQWNCTVPGYMPDENDPTFEWLNGSLVWFLTPDKRECNCTPVLSLNETQVEQVFLKRYPAAQVILHPGPDGMFNLTWYGAPKKTLFEMYRDPVYKNKAIGYYISDEGEEETFVLTFDAINFTHCLVEIDDGLDFSLNMSKVEVFEP